MTSRIEICPDRFEARGDPWVSPAEQFRDFPFSGGTATRATPKPKFRDKPRDYALTRPNERVRRLLSMNSALSGELARKAAPIDEILPPKEQIHNYSTPARPLSDHEKRTSAAQKAAIVRRRNRCELEYQMKTLGRVLGQIAPRNQGVLR